MFSNHCEYKTYKAWSTTTYKSLIFVHLYCQCCETSLSFENLFLYSGPSTHCNSSKCFIINAYCIIATLDIMFPLTLFCICSQVHSRLCILCIIFTISFPLHQIISHCNKITWTTYNFCRLTVSNDSYCIIYRCRLYSVHFFFDLKYGPSVLFFPLYRFFILNLQEWLFRPW